MGVKLRRLEVECFRGFSGRRVFEFPDGVTLIVGPVGSGKTSILSAVQFAFFGTDFYAGLGIIQRESLVNVGCREASVRLYFEVTGEGAYRLERRLARTDGRLVEHVVLETPTGEVFEGPSKVEGVIEEILGMDFQEFIRSASLSYVLVHMLAYGRPLTRSRALDILLGMNAVRSFHESISLSRVRSSLERTRAELATLRSEYEEAVRNLSMLIERRTQIMNKVRDIEKRLEELSARIEALRPVAEKYESLKREIESERSYISKLRERVKHAPSEVDLYKILEEAEDLRHSLRDVLERLKAPQRLLEALENLVFTGENASKALTDLEKIVDEAWSHYDRVWEDFQASAREVELKKAELAALEKVLVELEPSATEYEEAEERVQELESKYGKASELEEEVRKLEQEIKEISRRIQTSRSLLQLKQSLIEEASKRRSVQCQVCGTTLDSKSIEKVEEGVEQLTRSIIDLERKLSESEKRLRELREVLDDLRGLKVLLVSRELEYEKYKEYLERKESLDEEVREDEVKLREKEREYKELSAILTRVDEKVHDLRRRFAEQEVISEILKAEDRLRKLEEGLAEYEPKYREYVTAKSELDSLTKEKDSLNAQLKTLEESIVVDQVKRLEERIHSLESKLTKLESLYSRLERIKSATREILTELRRKRIEELNRKINEILRAVYPAEQVRAVELEVVEKRKKKGTAPTSYYEIFVDVGGTRYRFSELLSDGQKTIVVLSLLMAIYSQVRRNIDFVMLDEPLPNVDDRIKVNFLKSLSTILDIRQIILTTQAEDIAKGIEGVNILQL